MAVFDALGVVVPDMARGIDFYSRLGLEFPEGAANEGHVEADLPGGVRFMMDTEELVRSFDAGWEPVAGTRMGLAFLCADAADVDSTYQAIVDAGYESVLEPFDAFWGQRYATVHDPGGNRVDMFAPLGDA